MDVIPNFPELAVRNMWRDVKKNDYFMSYMPDYQEGRYPDKYFFYSILNTVYDNCIPRLV